MPKLQLYFCCLNIQYRYTTIAWVASIEKGVKADVDYSYKANSTADGVLNFMLAMGEVAFSYAGHNVVLEIQSTIPSSPQNPSKIAMWKGVIVAYIILNADSMYNMAQTQQTKDFSFIEMFCNEI